MKNLLIIIGLVLCSTTSVFSQDQTSFKFLYLSIRSSLDSDMNLNKFLKDRELKTLDNFHHGAGIGVEYQPNKYGVNVEANYDYIAGDTEFSVVQSKVALLLRILDTEKWTVNFAPFFAYSVSELKVIYNTENELDLQSNSIIDGGVLLLNMNYGNIGIGIHNSFTVKSTNVDFRIGYELALSESEWKSDNLKLLNFEKEKRNRLYFNLIIPLDI